MNTQRLADLRFVLEELVPQEPVPWEVGLELLAELERLTGERDRLAEALRDIECYPAGDSGHQDIAREALAGLPDNTNEGK